MSTLDGSIGRQILYVWQINNIFRRLIVTESFTPSLDAL